VLREILNQDVNKEDTQHVSDDSSEDDNYFNQKIETNHDYHNTDDEEEYERHLMQSDCDEEEKENSERYGSTNLSQLKKDFYERSKQLKHALTGIQS
jgi:hypothetical protein